MIEVVKEYATITLGDVSNSASRYYVAIYCNSLRILAEYDSGYRWVSIDRSRIFSKGQVGNTYHSCVRGALEEKIKNGFKVYQCSTLSEIFEWLAKETKND